MIVGHSLCARLYSNLTTGTNPRMTSSFSWTVKMDQISFLGRGGKWMAHIKNKDLHKICEVRPDIVAFIIGENDICSNTDPQKISASCHYQPVCETMLCTLKLCHRKEEEDLWKKLGSPKKKKLTHQRSLSVHCILHHLLHHQPRQLLSKKCPLILYLMW